MQDNIFNNIVKIFEKWNNEKIHIHKFANQKYAQQGQIWIVNLGVNIGSEQNGLRPCLVLNSPRKGEKTCVIVPASNTERITTVKLGKYRFLLHQARTIDTKRLLRLVERIKKPSVQELQKNFLIFWHKKTASITRSLSLDLPKKVRS